MKKISLMLICGVVLFVLCGCGNNVKEFYGTYQYESSTYNFDENDHFYKRDINITKDYVNLDFTIGDGSIFIKNNQIMVVYHNSIDNSFYDYMCFIKEENYINQTKCSSEIVDYVDKLHNIKDYQESEMYDFKYKLVK